MKTFLTIIGVIVGIIILAFAGVGVYAKFWWDDITFSADTQSLKSKLPSILIQLITNQKIPITVIVDNKNKIGVSIKNFQIKGFYENEQVFQSEAIELKIPADVQNYKIYGVVELFANAHTIKLINELIKNNQPTIQLTVSGTRLNLSHTFDYKVTF